MIRYFICYTLKIIINLLMNRDSSENIRNALKVNKMADGAVQGIQKRIENSRSSDVSRRQHSRYICTVKGKSSMQITCK